jgi:uncharacterized protein
MQINVAQILKAPVGSTRNHQVGGAVDISGNGVASEVYGEVELLRTNRGILVRGILHTEIEAVCSRCLTAFRCPMDLKIQEEYFPVIDVVSGAALALPDEPGSFTIDESHILDLTEAVRQYALLAKPMKPLCGENCAGLCPTCGHNLNQGPCDCSPQEVTGTRLVLSKLAVNKRERKPEGDR